MRVLVQSISKFYARVGVFGMDSNSDPAVIEATYQFNLAPWWNIQPDFQYIINPSGVSGSKNAAVFGVRTGIVF